ncbi:amidohydrolase family protein [Phenylobacterium sp.]|uniref:amidohydrolase family protein n=1 Tax=Phenylobacterium sp. TaxID=1871053 RepID=UPI002FE223F1
MPYAAGRVFHDADSHVMEPADWLVPFADDAWKDRLLRKDPPSTRPPEPVREKVIEGLIAGPKGRLAYGAHDPAERVHALNELGFASQLVFPTSALRPFRTSKDRDVLYAGARAANRAMAAFCGDPRLLGVAYVPLDDPGRALEEAQEAIRLGCRAIWVPSTPAGDKSPGHPDLDSFWALLAAKNIPFVLHIGAGSRTLPQEYVDNGKPKSPDLHGGGENLRFKDYVALPHSAEMFLSALIYDGLLDRQPELRGGIIEYGAYWVPGFLRQMDMGARSFGRTDPYLQKLSAKPSEIIRRQVKFTPFPGEDAGYLIRDSGADLYMFSSDYPHPEGTNDPIARFERTFEGLTDDDKDRFYRANFEEMMGGALAARPREDA